MNATLLSFSSNSFFSTTASFGNFSLLFSNFCSFSATLLFFRQLSLSFSATPLLGNSHSLFSDFFLFGNSLFLFSNSCSFYGNSLFRQVFSFSATPALFPATPLFSATLTLFQQLLLSFRQLFSSFQQLLLSFRQRPLLPPNIFRNLKYFYSTKDKKRSSLSWSVLIFYSRITCIGFPPTKAPAGTSRCTRVPAETMAPSPIVTPGRIVVFAPIITSSPITTSPRRYSLIKYSWAKIVVLSPMIEFTPNRDSFWKHHVHHHHQSHSGFIAHLNP